MSNIDLLRLVQVRPEFPANTQLTDVVRAMSEGEVGAVAVTEGRKLVGIFTERDLMTRIVAPGRGLAGTTIGEVMSSPAVMVGREATVQEAAAAMRSRHVRHLAVVDEDGDLLGIVSLRHLLYQLLDALEGKVEDQERFIMTDGPGG
jgi:CBS domain-containing protein